MLILAHAHAQVDGWLARKYNMGSVLGSILDPAADKLLMTTMVVTLAMKSMLPREPTLAPRLIRDLVQSVQRAACQAWS